MMASVAKGYCQPIARGIMYSWFVIVIAGLVINIGLILVLSLGPGLLVKRRLKSELLLKSRNKLVLTYDDGPGPLLTPPLLTLLADYGVRASFFIVGFRAQQHPEALAAIARHPAGHEMGYHAQRHRHPWRTLPWVSFRDMWEGYQTMLPWLTRKAPFRPPFGKLTLWTLLLARKLGSPLCFWTHDGGDTWPVLTDPRLIVDQVARDGGGVVLLHSHDRGDDRQHYVLALTRMLLETAREKGWQVCTVTELLNGNGDIDDHPNPTKGAADAVE
ncbi:polysaccharide deacetylase family protein [Desulfurivibrio sp. D14AmB]|uniref:polysaccharide deacetylase family protein n=1 Tax=Desulfurivibrio sp. D14AmB TaxID=3374370 RepID=UPI00376EDCF0